MFKVKGLSVEINRYYSPITSTHNIINLNRSPVSLWVSMNSLITTEQIAFQKDIQSYPEERRGTVPHSRKKPDIPHV
mgnify:CR=1 FL=1